MIIFGPASSIGNLVQIPKERMLVLNLFSFSEISDMFPRIDNLNPLTYCDHEHVLSSEMHFNQWYANFVLNTPSAYKQLIDIMRQDNNGTVVYICIEPSIEFSNDLTDALRQMIFDRYGVICNMINSMEEDIYNLKESEFTTEGLILLDSELEYYKKIWGYEHLQSDPL